MEKNNRILIVDDQQDLREQLAKLLRRSGKKNETTSFVQSMRDRLTGVKKEEPKNPDSADTYVVDTAAQGEEAFELVKKAIAETRRHLRRRF
jgi:CheY-like chemotaxis protein